MRNAKNLDRKPQFGSHELAMYLGAIYIHAKSQQNGFYLINERVYGFVLHAGGCVPINYPNPSQERYKLFGQIFDILYFCFTCTKRKRYDDDDSDSDVGPI